VFVAGAGKHKSIVHDAVNQRICLRKFGAGEGIRTLDPDLGKVTDCLRYAIRPPATLRQHIDKQQFY
jgi:hypothetical protein